ncbi:unnamed protein product [Victoria cruziana]
MRNLNPHAPSFFRPSHNVTPSPSPCLGLCPAPPPSLLPPHGICHYPIPVSQPQGFSFPDIAPVPPFYPQSGVGYSVPPAAAAAALYAPQRIIENLYVYLSPLCVNAVNPAIYDVVCKGTGGGRLPSAFYLPDPSPMSSPTGVPVSGPADVRPVGGIVVEEPADLKIGVRGKVSGEVRRLPRGTVRRSRGGWSPSQRRERGVSTYWRPKGGEAVAVEERRGEVQRLEFREEDAESVMMTTVMIRNIPNKLSREMLVGKLEGHCLEMNDRIRSEGSCTGGKEETVEPLSEFDFVYLPMDFRNKCNLGYAFVNFTSPAATWRLYRSLHNQEWRCYSSKKICEICYARIQGKEALKNHFRNSNFTCDSFEFLPIEFSPPRDGSSASEGRTMGRLRPLHLQR